MPWHKVEGHSECPVSEPWAVVEDDTGDVVGCHGSEQSANAQLAALNANVEDSLEMIDTQERTRAVPFTLERASDDGLTLTGYAAVFNDAVRIDSWEGVFDEIIAPGAFAKTIRERQPVMMFEHGHHPLVGSMPIGTVADVREDRRGLYVSARLHDNWLIEPVRDAVRDGSITGMSFRFTPVKEDVDESGGIPLITRTEVKLHELGPVVFPAYESTTVSVRSREVAAELDDPEFRADLARYAMFGTRLGAATQEHSTVEPPVDEPPSGTRRVPQAARRQRLRKIHIIDLEKKEHDPRGKARAARRAP